MKKSISLVFCAILVFSTFCPAKTDERLEKFDKSFSQKNVQKNFPLIFRPFKKFFRKLFGKERIVCRYSTPIVDVIALSLSESEIKTSNERLIEITTEASNPLNQTLFYYYQVSGGKIIGQGARVFWDLSDLAPGTYKITAAVDNGCGFCGKSMTKEIKIIECPDCN